MNRRGGLTHRRAASLSGEPDTNADVVIIGAGIVGLAVAYALKRRVRDLQIAVVDKEPRVACHQTGRNSGVIHTGVYYKAGSLKAKLCTQGRAQMVDFCQAEGIPHEICGKVIVATRDEELKQLTELERRAQANGVTAQRVDQKQLLEIEPEVSGFSGLHVPHAGIVNYAAVSERLKERLSEAGVIFHFESEVRGFSQKGADIEVETTTRHLTCRYVVNCGGLQSDRLAEWGGGAPGRLKIVPFRGEYFQLSPRARRLVNHLIYPVPNPDFPFLGVHFTRGIDGEVECGPNAVLNPGREAYEKGRVNLEDFTDTLLFPGFWRFASRHRHLALTETWRSFSKGAFLEAARRLIPRLEAGDLQPAPAGIRAQAITCEGFLVDDFALEESEYMLSVVNAPSPAATASFAIGEHIADRIERALRKRTLIC
jgi:L-2-hydroxyglutarate oxidase